MKNIFNKNNFNFFNILVKIKDFFIRNNLLLIYTILSFISCILVKYYTIGNIGTIYSNLFEINIILFIGMFSYLFKTKKGSYIYLLVLFSILTIINTINSVYYTFFSTFVSVSLIETAKQATTQGGAIFDRLKIYNFIFVVLLLIFVLINYLLNKKRSYNLKNNKRKNYFFFTLLILNTLLFFINISKLTQTDLDRLNNQWNKEYIVDRFGIIIYQLNDTVQTIDLKINTFKDTTDAKNDFLEYYSKNKKTKKNEYTNLFKGDNVIFLHLESIMNIFINMKINNQEITPNLNKLVKESMYFDNFYAQVSVGTSSDTEFTLNTSLMPVQSGTVAVSYTNRTFNSIEKMLDKKGYYTFSMHGNKSSMWNRQALHDCLGYKKFYAQDSYELDEIVGLGLSDHSFFIQSEKKINEINNMIKESKEYNNFMGTLIMLSNHTPFDDPMYSNKLDLTYHTGKKDKDGKEIIKNYLSNKSVGNYIQSVHYADQCLGEFIKYVKKSKDFKDTLFVLYGDHAAQLSRKNFSYLYNYNKEEDRLYTKEEEGYVDYDYYMHELNKKVPLIIFTTNKEKNDKIKGKYSYPMGMIDVLPTIGNMLNIKNKYSLGHDIFDIKNNNTVVFSNGDFLTKTVYYYNTNKEFITLKENTIVKEEYIESKKEYSERILNLSNNIIVYDLINKYGDLIK